MGHELEKQIKAARPPLRVVSPLAYWVTSVYAFFNIILGLSFLVAIDQNRFTAPLLIVNQFLTFDVWGVIFIGIGALKLFSLYTNDWNLARKSLIIGVSIKAAWTIALIFRIFLVPGTIFLTLLWAALAAIQIVTFIFFMPPNTNHYLQRRQERNDA